MGIGLVFSAHKEEQAAKEGRSPFAEWFRKPWNIGKNPPKKVFETPEDEEKFVNEIEEEFYKDRQNIIPWEKRFELMWKDAFSNPSPELCMISHKKSLLTIFGHKHKIKNFIQKFGIFHKKISPAFNFGLYLE